MTDYTKEKPKELKILLPHVKTRSWWVYLLDSLLIWFVVITIVCGIGGLFYMIDQLF